jgi:hypothetical protein
VTISTLRLASLDNMASGGVPNWLLVGKTETDREPFQQELNLEASKNDVNC